MPARAPDGDEPAHEHPDGADPLRPDEAEGSGRADPLPDDDAAPTAPGEGAPDDDARLAPEDVDARWGVIVSELTGAPDPRSWGPDPAVEEAEDHFEPPDPEPVLGGDPLLTMAWAAVVGVPLLLMLAAVVWRDIPDVVLQVAGAAFLVGVGLLLWRMPHERGDDPGPGAVV